MTSEALLRARMELRGELFMPLTVSTPPSQVEYIDGEPYVDAGELGGPSLSIRMGKYVDEESNITPFSAALWRLRDVCRRGHLGHTSERWDGALCHRLVMETVYWENSVADAADKLGLELEHAELRLNQALRVIFEDMQRRSTVPSMQAEPEEPSPSRLSRAICDAVNREVRDFDLEQRIWEAMRHKIPTLRTWEEEWAARQERILAHRTTCDRCRMDEAA